jgi:hypothetical protein
MSLFAMVFSSKNGVGKIDANLLVNHVLTRSNIKCIKPVVMDIVETVSIKHTSMYLGS